ncbi:hypothetical protein ES705_30427 [subsurface metagenome]|jgi:hypothetical protein
MLRQLIDWIVNLYSTVFEWCFELLFKVLEKVFK